MRTIDAIDSLCQIRDELRVVWMAIGNEQQAEAHLIQIGEHVNGLTNRVSEIIDGMKAGNAAPKMVGGERHG